MTPEDLVRDTAPRIGTLGAAFYFHPDTLATGKEHGLDGFRLYILGRGGVLGDVEPRVVTSAFGYFHPSVIERMWTTAREKMAPRDAGRLYLGCCHALGRARLSGVEGLDAFCDAAEAVNAAAEPAGLALYAAVSAEPLPDDPPARALHLLTVLREHRGSCHLVAVVASGLAPAVAHYLRRPDAYAMFGWGDTPPAVDAGDRERLARADELTDRLLLPAYSSLDGRAANAFTTGIDAIAAALAAP